MEVGLLRWKAWFGSAFFAQTEFNPTTRDILRTPLASRDTKPRDKELVCARVAL
jgi:hypothetical protein